MSSFLVLIVTTALLLVSQAAVFNGVRFQTVLKKGCAFGGALFLPFADFKQPPTAHAIPALEAATRAMTEKKEKTEEVDREFNSLPEGAKKRYALGLCKDSSARKAGGYDSSQECTEAVFQGNYKNIVEGVSSGSSRKASPSSSSSGGGSSSAKKDEPIMIRSPKATIKSDGPLVKVQDLSDLTPAGNPRQDIHYLPCFPFSFTF